MDKLIDSLMAIQESHMVLGNALMNFTTFVRNLALSTGYRTPENASEPIELEVFMLWLAKRGDLPDNSP